MNVKVPESRTGCEETEPGGKGGNRNSGADPFTGRSPMEQVKQSNLRYASEKLAR
jgi:hypothetical protein